MVKTPKDIRMETTKRNVEKNFIFDVFREKCIFTTFYLKKKNTWVHAH